MSFLVSLESSGHVSFKILGPDDSGVRLRLVKSTAEEKDFEESSWSLSQHSAHVACGKMSLGYHGIPIHCVSLLVDLSGRAVEIMTPGHAMGSRRRTCAQQKGVEMMMPFQATF